MITHIVLEKQSIFDVALKYYGTVDGVFDIIKRNPTVGLANAIPTGTKLLCEPDTTNDFANYFKKNSIEPANGDSYVSLPENADFNNDFNNDFLI